MPHAWRSSAPARPADRRLSSALAALLPEREVVPLGRHALKDIDEPQPIYGLSASLG